MKSLDPFSASSSLDAQIVPPWPVAASLLSESSLVGVVFSVSEIKVLQVHLVHFLSRPLIFLFCFVLSSRL